MTKLKTTASLAAALLLATSASALAADTKIGILLGFTGPLDTLSPPMADAANLAAKNINDQGGLLGGNVVTQTGDDNCVTADMATAAATQLINDGAVGIVGADEMHLVPLQPLEPHPDIGLDVLHDMADVERAVRVR